MAGNPIGAERPCVHFNLFDRERQIPRIEVDSDALKRCEEFEPWGLRDDVQEVFGRRNMCADDGAKAYSRDTITLKLRA